jgi:hypothetical protein
MEGNPGAEFPRPPPKEEEVKSRFTKKRVIIALAAVGVLAIVGVAAAFFTSSGTGTGSATVGSTGNVTIDSVTITGDLFPGGDAATVSYTVNNATGKSVKVGDVVADTGAGTNGITGLPAGCSASDFTYTSDGALNTTIADGDHADGTGTLSLANSSSNQDACQGATPTLHLKVDNSGL